MSSPKKYPKFKTEWDLTLLYKSPTDPQIERDVQKVERLYADFAKKYDTKAKKYLENATALLKALSDYEKLSGEASAKPFMYFHYRQHLNSADIVATEKIALLSNRATIAGNKVRFFELSLGKIAKEKQSSFLSNKKLSHFKVFLERIFSDARHALSEPEEKILSLKSLPAYSLWVQGNEKLLGSKYVMWPKGKNHEKCP